MTIEAPDELSELVTQAGNRLSELPARSLTEPVLLAYVYCHVLDSLPSRPTQEQMAAFGPTPRMTERLRALRDREGKGEITPEGKSERYE